MAIQFLNSIDLTGNQLLNAAAQNLGTLPSIDQSAPDKGRILFDTSDYQLKVITSIDGGTTWSWQAVGAVRTIDTNNTTFVDMTPTNASTGAIVITSSLSATGTPDATKYLRGDNTWATIADGDTTYTIDVPAATTSINLKGNDGSDDAIALTSSGGVTITRTNANTLNIAGPSGTMSNFFIQSNNGAGSKQEITNGQTAIFLGGTLITGEAAATDTITFNHDDVARSNGSSAASPGSGGNFTAVDSITTNAQGHITAVNTATVTLPASGTMTSWDIGDGSSVAPVAQGVDVNIVGGTGIDTSLGGTDVTLEFDGSELPTTSTYTKAADQIIVIDGGASSKISSTNIALGDFGNSMSDQKIIDVLNPTAAQDAATKSYVDSAIANTGQFQGGYNAATNTPDLDVNPSASIQQGWMWAVTDAGTFFSEAVQAGDFIFANTDNPGTTFSNWTVVQSGQEIAGAGATDGATNKGIAGFDNVHFSVSANGWVQANNANNTTTGVSRNVGAGPVSVNYVSGVGTITVADATSSANGIARVAAGTGITVSDSGGVFTVSTGNGSITSKKISLNITAGTGVTRANSAGITTYTIALGTAWASGIEAANVMCEVIQTASYDTVYTEVGRGSASSTNLQISLSDAANAIANDDYYVLLHNVE
tara:strand:- start:246 stop:2204 length:1959 start_codon:yes stop_codon:yes gene_type:complete